jgi:hypothetical protein
MGSFSFGPHKPTVRIQVGGQPVTFMVDISMEHLVVTTPVSPLSGKTATILGSIQTQAAKQPFCQARLCEIGGHKVCHEFLYMPDCPIPLLGQDILSKLGTQITFKMTGHATLEINPGSAERDSIVTAVIMLREEEWRPCCMKDESLKPLQPPKDFPLA